MLMEIASLTRIRSESRLEQSHPTQSQYQWGPPGFETLPSLGTFNYYANGTCTDEVHKYPYKEGGPLLIRKSVTSAHPSPLLDLQSGWLRFRGHMFCNPWWVRNREVLDDAWYAANMDNADDHSVEAWNRFRPGKPDASLAQFLGELREIPRTLQFKVKGFREKGYHGRDFGSDYLNIQFGWLPVIRDLQSFYRAYKNLETRLEQLKRDNGRPIRRRGTINESIVTDPNIFQGYAYANMTPSLTNGFYHSVPSKWLGRQYEKKVWFSGRFRYWIPDIGTPQWERRAIIALFGGNLTPSLAWELMPWSWLIDWFSNIGDVLENMSQNAAENLTADYAYTMLEESRRVTRASSFSARSRLDGPFQVRASEEVKLVLKHRVHASPFGFGLTEGDLSTRQIGILSALGLTFT